MSPRISLAILSIPHLIVSIGQVRLFDLSECIIQVFFQFSLGNRFLLEDMDPVIDSCSFNSDSVPAMLSVSIKE